MDEEEPTSAAAAGSGSTGADETAPTGDDTTFDEVLNPPIGLEPAAGAGIASLPWDDDLPVALGDETEVVTSSLDVHTEGAPVAGPGGEGELHDDLLDADADVLAGPHDDDYDDDLEELSQDPVGGRRNALPRRVETWRSRSATGAIATAVAMGLQQVFEPERRRPAIVAEAPGDPYSDDDPVTVDYVPDDAEGTKVHVKPWLLQKGDPT